MINMTAYYEDIEYSLDDILPDKCKPYIKFPGQPYAYNVYLNWNETMREWLDKNGCDYEHENYEWWIN